MRRDWVAYPTIVGRMQAMAGGGAGTHICASIMISCATGIVAEIWLLARKAIDFPTCLQGSDANLYLVVDDDTLGTEDETNLVDPDQPPAQPEDALSDSDEEDDGPFDYSKSPEYVSPRQCANTVRRDHMRCLLCGRKDDLSILRLLANTDMEEETLFMWLKRFGVIPAHYDRNHLANLMTVCADHNKAYRQGVWRLVPCAALRKDMLTNIPAEREDAAQHEDAQPRAPASQIEPTAHLMDLVVFCPDHMPSLSGLDAFNGSDFPADTNMPPQTFCRVLPESLLLPVNPYLAYAGSLRMMRATYWPRPDAALATLEYECLEIRRMWNDSVLSKLQNPLGSLSTLYIPMYRSP
ncbi:hypothetical protein A0H81_07225 [Grifola frondosa]|uniref:Uncharacterized protein n=1 Tax=Grifola frondosa TaxID=5627 RepID=A0A1C7M9E2_GRIFR|nr:hypothetical protein A0H81_07225 [Grifola frondosa]